MCEPDFRVLAFTHAGPADQRAGLIGFLCIRAGCLILDGVTLRRSAEGAMILSYPARTDRHGNRHAIVRPIDGISRAAIEGIVFEQLRGIV